MSDKTAENSKIVNAPIGGPSAAQLRQPSSKSLDQIAAELRRRNYEAIEAALADGHARGDKRVQQKKFASQGEITNE